MGRLTTCGLGQLFDAGLPLADFGHGRGRYEAAPREHHDHLLDVDTGRVIEFSNPDIEALQERVARELGFELVGHRLELYGVPLAKKKSAGRKT